MDKKKYIYNFEPLWLSWKSTIREQNDKEDIANKIGSKGSRDSLNDTDVRKPREEENEKK